MSNIFPKFFYSFKLKTISKKVYHWFFNNQPIQLSSSSEGDKILFQREKVNFKKNPTLFCGTIFLSPILFNSGIFSFYVMTLN